MTFKKHFPAALLGLAACFLVDHANAQWLSQQATTEQKASCERWGNVSGTADFNRCIYGLIGSPKPPRRGLSRTCAIDRDLTPDSPAYTQCAEEVQAAKQKQSELARSQPSSQRAEPSDPTARAAWRACANYGYVQGTDSFANCVQGKVEAIERQEAAADQASRRCTHVYFMEQDACRANPDAYFARKDAAKRAEEQQFQPRPTITCTNFGSTTTCQ